MNQNVYITSSMSASHNTRFTQEFYYQTLDASILRQKNEKLENELGFKTSIVLSKQFFFYKSYINIVKNISSIFATVDESLILEVWKHNIIYDTKHTRTPEEGGVWLAKFWMLLTSSGSQGGGGTDRRSNGDIRMTMRRIPHSTQQRRTADEPV